MAGRRSGCEKISDAGLKSAREDGHLALLRLLFARSAFPPAAFALRHAQRGLNLLPRRGGLIAHRHH